MLTNDNVHKDLITECLLLKEIWYEDDISSTKIRGSVQFFSISPFIVHIFCEKQLDIYINKRRDNRISLYLDATGSVIRNIPNQDKRVLYYALVMCGDVNQPPLPIAELISNVHSVPHLTHWLMSIRHAIITISTTTEMPAKVEVDFSWALINSAVLAFNQCSVREYLDVTWRILSGKKKILANGNGLCVVHICCSHFIHAVAINLKRFFGKNKIFYFVMKCIAKMLECMDLDSLAQCVVQFVNCFQCETLTNDTISAHNFFNGVDVSYGIDTGEYIFTDSDNEQCQIMNICSLRESSPFTKYFNNIVTKCRETIEDTNDNDNEKNCNYYPSIIDKIMKEYLPLVPLWSGLMLGDLSRHNKDNADCIEQPEMLRESNACVENWFRIVKINILNKQTKLRAGTFMRKLHTALKGRLVSFENDGIKTRKRRNTKRKVNNIELSEEMWQKKTKKDTKKCKYVTDRAKRTTFNVLYEQEIKVNDSDSSHLEIDSNATRGKFKKNIPIDNNCTNQYSNSIRSQKHKNSTYSVCSDIDDNTVCDQTLIPTTVEDYHVRELPAQTVETDGNDGNSFTTQLQVLKGPHWGGVIHYNKRTITLTNTCTIDNFMYIFSTLFKWQPYLFNPLFGHCENCDNLCEMCSFGANEEWESARLVWLTKMCNFGGKNKTNTWDLYGTEIMFFISHLKCLLGFKLILTCSEAICPIKERHTAEIIFRYAM